MGMIVQQFKSGMGGSDVGFATEGVGSDKLYGKIIECSGLKLSEKPNSTTTPKLLKIPPTQPSKTKTTDGVFEEPLRAPPQKQVCIRKPNHLKKSFGHTSIPS